MDIRRPVFLKLWPWNVEVISGKYVQVISDNYLPVGYIRQVSGGYIQQVCGSYIQQKKEPNFFFFFSTLIIDHFWAKLANSETNVFSLISPKESFCNQSIWLSIFVNGINKMLQ